MRSEDTSLRNSWVDQGKSLLRTRVVFADLFEQDGAVAKLNILGLVDGGDLARVQDLKDAVALVEDDAIARVQQVRGSKRAVAGVSPVAYL